MPRDVYLGAFDMGALYAAEQGLRHNGAPQAHETDLFRLLCVTLMQAGADRFAIPGGHPPAFTSSEYLIKRIANERHESADASWALIVKVFDQFLPKKSDYRVPGVGDAQRLKYLISDIVRAMESGSSIAVVARLPDLNSAANVLPPELVVPARTLIKALTTDKATVPVPVARVAKRDVALLEELLQSDVYLRYRDAHGQLQLADVGTAAALRQVSSTASDIQRFARKHIHLVERAVSFLPATTTLIEELAGKAPGVAAEALASIFSHWLSSRSRLVVYRFDMILDELMAAYEDPLTDVTAGTSAP